MNEGENSGAPVAPENGGIQPQFSSAPNINTQTDQTIETVTASSADYANAFSVTSETSSDKNVTVGAASAIKAGQGSDDAVLAGNARYGAEEAPTTAVTSGTPDFFAKEMAKQDQPKRKKEKKQKAFTLPKQKTQKPQNDKVKKLTILGAIILVLIIGGITIAALSKKSTKKADAAILAFVNSKDIKARQAIDELGEIYVGSNDASLLTDEDFRTELKESLASIEDYKAQFAALKLSDKAAQSTILQEIDSVYAVTKQITEEFDITDKAVNGNPAALETVKTSDIEGTFEDYVTKIKERNDTIESLKRDYEINGCETVDESDEWLLGYCSSIYTRQITYDQKNTTLRFAQSRYVKYRFGDISLETDKNPLHKAFVLAEKELEE